MKQEELIKKYEEIADQKMIGYFKPYRHFMAAKKFYSQLQDGVADENTFFTETMVVFNECDDQGREPDFTSSSGSRYWYSKEGVVRGSDHGGKGVALCDWALKTKEGKTIYGYDYDCPIHMNKARFAFARWEDFIFKASLIEAGGQKAVTTFNNTVGYGIFRVGDKDYKRTVTVEYPEYTGEEE